MQSHRIRATAKLVSGLTALGLFALASASNAQSFPNKPIRVINGSAPGGIVDIYARRHAPHLGTLLGQPIVVENRPGASGSIAADAGAKATPDGHTLYMGSQNELGLIGQLGIPIRYDPVKDLTAVGLTVAGYPLLVVSAQLGPKTAAELVQYMKSRNASTDCAGAGSATVSHFVCAAFAVRTQTKVQYVPYKTGIAGVTDVAGGQLAMAATWYSEAEPLMKQGRVIPIGVFGPSRLPLLPNVPTMAEQGFKDLELLSYTVYTVPSATPVDIQRRLNDAIAKAASQPDNVERMKNSGAVFIEMNLEETQAWQKRVQLRWNAIVKETGIKIEQ